MSAKSNSTKPMMVTLRPAEADENSSIPGMGNGDFLIVSVPFRMRDWM